MADQLTAGPTPNGSRHVVGLSGGKDSTVLAFMLKDREPETDWEYICTPTGDESADMIQHWNRLEEALGKPLIRITNPKAPTLDALIQIQGMLPNFRARFCTRMLKIEPTIAWCVRNAPVLMHVGLRADEDEREGIYGDLVKSRFPFREWGIDYFDVMAYLPFLETRYGIVIPERTDCLRCYHQRVKEWWNFWNTEPAKFEQAAALEDRMGHTLRSPGRDSWPVSLRDMGALFSRLRAGGAQDWLQTQNAYRKERGLGPLKGEIRRKGEICRVCTI